MGAPRDRSVTGAERDPANPRADESGPLGAAAPEGSSAEGESLAFEPWVRLGAESPGGLALPSATPGPDTLYAPRGVWFNDDVLVVSDSGNHRILIWHGIGREISVDFLDRSITELERRTLLVWLCQYISLHFFQASFLATLLTLS